MIKFPENLINGRSVYLDHAAATPTDKQIVELMNAFHNEKFGNPSSLHRLGREATNAISDSRSKIAKVLYATDDTIFFTSGGTESDNLAILGIARSHKNAGKHIITTKIEHPAVLKACAYLESQGFEITHLSVDKFGFIDIKEFIKALRTDTILVSIMYANNEIGTIEPIPDIGREILKWRKANNTPYQYFHSDACQAGGALLLDVEKLHVDLLTLNGGKIYGPKGVGVLYKKRGVNITALQFGGFQEARVRPGTENVATIVGMGEALKNASENTKENNKKITEIRNYLWKSIKKEISNVLLNGPELDNEIKRLPNNLNVSFLNTEGEALLL